MLVVGWPSRHIVSSLPVLVNVLDLLGYVGLGSCLTL
jgi:hypothetical protein